MSFADLKRRRGNLEKLTAAAEKLNGGEKNYSDDRLWRLTRDKQGNGYAVIRFLPAAEGNELPWTRYWDHGFQGPTGQWYIERSLTSIGQDDPVGELNGRLWNTGIESDKEKARKQKRRLHYVANVLIVSDPANPDNEGKVMIYQFGKKIFDMIMDAMQPEYPDEEPMNPFDFWEGANFKLKARVVDGWVNYDKSEFASPQALSNDDEELEKIYNQLHDLREFTDPKNYKTYNELKARLTAVLGETSGMGARPMREEVQMNDEIPYDRFEKSSEAPSMATAEASEIPSASEDEEEDVLARFAALAAGN